MALFPWIDSPLLKAISCLRISTRFPSILAFPCIRSMRFSGIAARGPEVGPVSEDEVNKSIEKSKARWGRAVLNRDILPDRSFASDGGESGGFWAGSALPARTTSRKPPKLMKNESLKKGYLKCAIYYMSFWEIWPIIGQSCVNRFHWRNIDLIHDQTNSFFQKTQIVGTLNG